MKTFLQKIGRKKILIETCGWVGSLLILLGYFLYSFEILFANDPKVHAVNFAGAFLFGISLFFKKSHSGVFLQTVFAAIAAVNFFRVLF